MYDVETIDDLDMTYQEYCDDFNLDSVDNCPICETNIAPILQCVLSDNYYHHIVVVCPKCGDVFMQKWDIENWSGEIFPKKAIVEHFDPLINELSENFVKIYNQSKIAESNYLDEVAGMGYRKSLEFLIKDYISRKNPDNIDTIQKTALGNCINEYVENDKIKEMARRASWIGNDEAHYLRKWADKDISDLKSLIGLTVYWISYELKTEEYIRTMQ